MKKILIILTLILCVAFPVNAQRPGSKTLKIGDQAPDLVHIQKWIKGTPVPTFEKGKTYLVDISETTCPGCIKIIPDLKRIADKFRGKVEVIAVYVTGNSNSEFLKKFVEKTGLNYTVAMDMADNTTDNEWGVLAYPSTFIVNQGGRIVSFGHSEQELESVLKSWMVTEEVKQELQEDPKNIERNRIIEFDKRLWSQKEVLDLPGRLHLIDSILPYVSDDVKYNANGYNLLMEKYETLLLMNDSIAADNCLKEQMANTPEGSWFRLALKFHNEFIPRYVGHRLLPFNYDRFLVICDSASKDLGGILKVSTRCFQAGVMYWYDPYHNKEAALEVLTEAENEAKKKDQDNLDFILETRENIENHFKQLQQANDDWKELGKLINDNSQVAFRIDSENRGYSDYILKKERLARRILASSASFWDKCIMHLGEDQRKLTAFHIFAQAHMYNLIRWVDTTALTPELSAKIDSRYQQGKEYYKQGQSLGKQIATGPPLFRMFPRDLKAEQEWRQKRDEMARIELQWIASWRYPLEFKEKIDWELFVSDWGQVNSLWNELPARDERPDISIKGEEDSYWKLLATHYWKATWMSFREYLERYASLPIIADRALDFLGGTAGTHNTKELVKSYWKELLDTYGNPKHPLAKKAGIEALVKQAKAQFEADKIATGEKAVELEPFTSLDGRQADLANLRGKVVVIDFWATWCKPCLESMPELKSMYDKYHEKGLEVIGVNLDNKEMEAQVKQVIEKQGILWPQRFEGKGMNDPLAKLYIISSLPTVWLLDKDGKIADINARGERLEPLIKKYLGLE
jgi:thiol-disulfide isomerase/thioredoxin